MNDQLAAQFTRIREQTEMLCRPLLVEDYVIQGMDDVSPPKWHLAHISWFFETFILQKYVPGYVVFDSSFHYLFNSYYQTIGSPHPRPLRGMLSRPTVEQVYAYRHYVDKHMLMLCDKVKNKDLESFKTLITLGLQHEQQHQELLLMDIKYNFSLHPNKPCYNANKPKTQAVVQRNAGAHFIEQEGGVVDIGYNESQFCFDHELPRHKKFLRPYALACRLVTNAEYLEFIDAGGYKDPRFWLADGWDLVNKNNWQAPAYWYREGNEWLIFTLNGLQPVTGAEPVAHVSYYEAEAYARWRNARLPTEEEWEHFSEMNQLNTATGVFLESGSFHPKACEQHDSAQQFFGDLWEWTASPYSSYPGFKSLKGALGEYNGKFMANQMVLRGGCCVTPQEHIRASYRNFFQPEKRWQFSGIRLAYNG